MFIAVFSYGWLDLHVQVQWSAELSFGLFDCPNCNCPTTTNKLRSGARCVVAYDALHKGCMRVFWLVLAFQKALLCTMRHLQSI